MAELSTIARPYAEAVFASASATAKEASMDSWTELLSKLAKLASLTDVRNALSDPRINVEQRISLFTELINSPLSDQANNLIRLLVENNRILLLPEISAQFEFLKNKLEGTAAAEITSAFPLSKEEVKQLVTGLEKKINLKLKPNITIDESLIGGIRVVVGDQVLDTSVQAQLASMRDTLVA